MSRTVVSGWVALTALMLGCGGERVRPVVDAGLPLPNASCLDSDGDGVPGTGDCSAVAVVDCNDSEPLAYPGAPEQCNGLDDSCNAEVDEGLPVVAYYRDEDGDGVGSTKVGEGCHAPPAGAVTASGDCNDQDMRIRPGAAETCNDIDDDCDSAKDNGLPFQDFYDDHDGDTFGDPLTVPVTSCLAAVQGRVPNRSDCDDNDPTIKPGAAELCNKIDDNCDAQVDNGIAFQGYYPDVDGDGFGSAGAQPESSCAPVAGKVTNNADCNDTLATVKPGAPEVCNGLDDNCDARVDENLQFANYYTDADGDGFGAAAATPASSCVPIPGKVTNNGDCNDGNATVKPGATEECNGVDDNCNTQVDDGLTFQQYFTDADGDAFGAGQPTSSCVPLVGKVTNNTDCDDTNPSVKPGATEVCNSVDDDCDTVPDDGLTFRDFYTDGDGDGYGAGTAASSCLTSIAGKVQNNTDCNDASAAIKPGAPEVCNNVDDNCNSQIDDGLTFINYYVDGDVDGHGAGQGQLACAASGGRVASNDDCNDLVATTYPGAPEMCNGVDDNCDTFIDNGTVTQNYYTDADTDGYGTGTAQPSCSPVPGKVTNNTDCDDTRASVHPGAVEVCNNRDDDCAGGVDNGLTFVNYYVDGDVDGYGAGTAQPACAPVAGRVTNNTDCADGNGAVHPGATEICNGLDDNCAGGIDEGLPTQVYYVDGDTDGYGAGTGTSSCSVMAGRVTVNGDCDDTRSAVHPGATEVCNGRDDNCVGGTDEGNPGGGAACSTGQPGVCGPGTMTCQTGSLTCVRNTGPTTETCDNQDNNCNGTVDDPWVATKGLACSVGLGVCLRSGVNVCNAAHTGLECSVTAGAPTSASCDGLDNDCDGVADEPVLTNTNDVSLTAYQDVEFAPYYYTAGQCADGTSGSIPGTDALQGGGLAMSVGATGILFQRLNTAGNAVGSSTSPTSLSYSDVAMAQAADGFVIAGIWQSNNKEIDLYYVDANGTFRTYLYTQFNTGNILDSLRVVRANGKRVVLVWREAGVGIKMARAEVCYDSFFGTWDIMTPGCLSYTLSSTTISPSTTAVPGVGADSAFSEWNLTTSCTPNLVRTVSIAYLSTATSLNQFIVTEDGQKGTETVVRTETSPRTLAEPDLAYFESPPGTMQWAVAWVQQDSGATRADLDFWLSNDPTGFHWVYLAYATQNGADSIQRPRVSATATNLWFSALRYDADPTVFKRQIMTRTTDFAGTRLPGSQSVELSATSGGCSGDPACRPGDKSGFTNFAPFGKVYYSGSGSTPSGTYSSTLTCN